MALRNPVLTESLFDDYEGNSSNYGEAEASNRGIYSGDDSASDSTSIYSDRRGDMSSSQVMTMSGTCTKSLFLLGLVFFSAALSWVAVVAKLISVNNVIYTMLGTSTAALVVGLVIYFMPKQAAILSMLYAFFEGFSLGLISLIFNKVYDGIVLQAIFLTFGVAAGVFALYRFEIIKVTDKLRMGIISAVFGVCILYMGNMLLGFMGLHLPYLHDGGIVSIIIGVVIAGIAAFSLLLDFDLIDRGVKYQAPKYFEWYCAYGLMVTLVWLYLEILKVLAASKRR